MKCEVRRLGFRRWAVFYRGEQLGPVRRSKCEARGWAAAYEELMPA